uniref:Uncharacterized protein n=1 Tax=Anopheles coluzzii TaxID=1518534 RepID=A0A8W7PHA9_ANOCL
MSPIGATQPSVGLTGPLVSSLRCTMPAPLLPAVLWPFASVKLTLPTLSALRPLAPSSLLEPSNTSTPLPAGPPLMTLTLFSSTKPLPPVGSLPFFTITFPKALLPLKPAPLPPLLAAPADRTVAVRLPCSLGSLSDLPLTTTTCLVVV